MVRMRKIFIAALLGLAGCAGKTEKPNKVVKKMYHGADGVSPKGYALPPCICEYQQSIGYTFQDSCNKYNVGDTIK